MPISIISAVRRIILVVLILISLLIAGIFFALKNGITIEKMDLITIKVSGFYLKLNKKLAVEIDQIDFPGKTESRGSIEQTQSILNEAKHLLPLFEKVLVRDIQISDYTASVHYEADRFFVDTKEINFKVRFTHDDGLIRYEAESIIYKEIGLLLNGTGSFHLSEGTLAFDGEMAFPETFSSDINITGNTQRIDFAIQSEHFESLDIFRSTIPIENPNISAWVYDNIQGSRFRLKHLAGSLNLEDFGNDQDLLSLEGILEIDNATIKYHPDLPVVRTKKVTATLSNNQLDFKIDAPVYEGISAQGSRAWIAPLFSGDAHLFIHLFANSILDERIRTILETYDINLPLIQHTSTTDAEVFLDMRLADYGLQATGNFHAKNANYSLNRLDFTVDYAHAELNNSMVYITDSRASLGDYLDTKMDFSIDTRERFIKGIADIQSFEIRHLDEEVIRIADTVTPFTIDFSDDTVLKIKSLDSTVTFADDNIFDFSDISKLEPYSPLLQKFSLKEGSLRLRSKDFKFITIDTNLTNIVSPLTDSKGEASQLVSTIKIDEESLAIESENKKLKINIQDKITINILNYGIDLEAATSGDDSLSTLGKPLKITGQDSNITLGGKSIFAENYSIEKEGNLTLVNLYSGGGHLFVEKYPTHSFIKGSDFKATFINTLLGQKAFEEGTFNVVAEEHNDTVTGYLKVRNAVLRDLKGVNNFLAFLDTIPSLVTFRDPGYSAENGYPISDGTIHYVLKDNIMQITSMQVNGGGMDLSGQGYVDFSNQTMDMVASLQTVKSFSKIIDAIPVFGYIIMGEDGVFSTDFEISGSIEKPEIQSRFFMDTFLTPLNFIKRALQTPFQILIPDSQESPSP